MVKGCVFGTEGNSYNISVVLSKTDVFLLIYSEFKTNFIAESIIVHGVSAYERALTKEKSNFYFQECRHLVTREGPLMGMCKHR